ncbi:hypothetical protein NDU88_002542 [Pleurodeles waltl]|uniref:Uncharacterized protein n=1 Tax=Pleurodeles waltl TaxID=8319 RepID=A0AAV7LCL8_PLEWA|nr:hypothetical protein NDU88_002542 [Pleurodeles waltl]
MAVVLVRWAKRARPGNKMDRGEAQTTQLNGYPEEECQKRGTTLPCGSCLREGLPDWAPRPPPREGPQLECNKRPGVADLRSGVTDSPPNYQTLKLRGTGEEKTENPEACEEGG